MLSEHFTRRLKFEQFSLWIMSEHKSFASELKRDPSKITGDEFEALCDDIGLNDEKTNSNANPKNTQLTPEQQLIEWVCDSTDRTQSSFKAIEWLQSHPSFAINKAI